MRAVADRRPGIGENFQFVTAGIIDARMAAGDCHVAEGRARTENSCISEILRYRFSIAVQNFQKFAEISPRMNMDRHVQFLRRGDALLQERRFAGLGLGGIQDALYPTIVCAVVLLDELNGKLQTRAAFVCALFIVMATFRIREDVMATERRAEKYPSAGLADDRNMIIKRPRSATGIQHGCRAVSKRTVKGILPPRSHRLRRWRFDFLF